MSYPVAVEIDYVQKRSRLSNFFRLLLAIPLVIVAYVWVLLAYVVVIVAWFALLFTGRWPTGMYKFMVGVVGWYGRFLAYTHLLTDAYPPFGLSASPDYPVHVTVAPPLEKYSRLKVFFRVIYELPVFVVAYLIAIMLGVMTVISWLSIVFTGRQPEGIQNIVSFGVGYYTRATALFWMVTETYPPLSNA